MVGILRNITLPTYLPHILGELSLREFTCSPVLDTKRLMYERTWKFINDQFYDGKNHPDTKAADIPTYINHLINLIRSKPSQKRTCSFSVHTSLVPDDDKGGPSLRCMNMLEYVR
jgi:hypothetical protein